MTEMKNDQIRQGVRDNYKQVALKNIDTNSCCAPSCCTPDENQNISVKEISQKMGYTTEELTSIPNGANMGLGCGNPQAIAALKEGETVLDLGSGGGFDCFLAAPKVGLNGKVIGVDMTPEMISKARKNAEKLQFKHVEFRLGEIENLPVANQSVDVIMSNCVINLSPNKLRVFEEAYRVLKDGGRLAISDVILTTTLPTDMKQNMALYSGCITGASTIEELTAYLQEAGFKNIQITPKDESKEFIKEWAPEHQVEEYIVSAIIQAVK
ncbi:arsenite methyltransferase [Viridibacillus sp. FSL R5-0477]|uniref:Arsenite methyltransferase n=1 Tax=Viridibacillus arenosi FSL R5-213 TaxID=1227360 RepID=W4EUB2_9BACL|nr:MULTISPECIES: arsenite methyltransferase [Viridibacillus]ETT84098.1 arsenite S-adenosylmethyltransferase [Viridibacillus arenosi FSL R5-213]OMC79315.1 arsenite S-adenosylmethyltransferase [Viridibacillus sp. FSL H8-0123]OMC90102.1 arsenite S-adenosylmethyltransferase [Viridibacillus arenosi]